MGALFNLLYIRGNEYDHLNQYNEAFDNRRKNAEKLGSLFASEALRDLVLAECVEQNDTRSDLYSMLYNWSQMDVYRPDPKDNDAWEE